MSCSNASVSPVQDQISLAIVHGDTAVAYNHDVAKAKRMLEEHPDEHTIEGLLWSAADHGCPEIVAMVTAAHDPGQG
jgi:hypothetical protein